jgi:hypothetical protein
MVSAMVTLAVLLTLGVMLAPVCWHYAYYYVDAKSLMGWCAASAVTLWFATFAAILWWWVFSLS